MGRVYTVNVAGPRGRVLAAADKLLRAEGATAVTTRRIASDVGVTAMAIYRHFRDKNALLDALVAIGFARWEARLAKAVKGPTPMARIEGALRAYRDFALAEPRYFELMFLIPRPRVPVAPGSLSQTPSPSFGKVVQAVTEAMQARALPPGDPGRLMLMVWATAHGLVALHFSGRFGFDVRLFKRQYDETTTLLLTLLAVRDARG
jgi:AcrR family transcriptional regulator